MQTIFLVGFVLIPAVLAVALLGPLRRWEHRRLVPLYGGLVVFALLFGALYGATRPDRVWELGVAAAAVLLGPATGVIIALRLELVRSDRRAAFILLPLGFLAGCAAAIRVMVALGFGM